MSCDGTYKLLHNNQILMTLISKTIKRVWRLRNFRFLKIPASRELVSYSYLTKLSVQNNLVVVVFPLPPAVVAVFPSHMIYSYNLVVCWNSPASTNLTTHIVIHKICI
jgi:hypothetical protein